MKITQIAINSISTARPSFEETIKAYAKAGFKRIPRGRATMPGPVDPDRLLVAELVEGAFEGVEGKIRPDHKLG